MAKSCVLVLDDEHMLEELLEHILGRAGYNHISFRDGTHALNFIKVSPILLSWCLLEEFVPTMGHLGVVTFPLAGS